MKRPLIYLGLVALAAIVVVLFIIARPKRALPLLGSAPQQQGVSISFLRFVDTGSPSGSVYNATTMPTTNWSIFGPRSSGAGATNMTFTNSITGGPAAVYQYTNASQYSTFVAVQSLERQTGSTWKAVPLPTEAKTMVQVPSNSVVTQTIPVTATNVSWRITVFCIEQAKGLTRTFERAKELGEQAVTGQKTEHFSGRKYLIKSSPPSAR